MTTEEFHGLLMGVLSGPAGPGVVHRVLEIALSDPTTADLLSNMLADAFDAALGGIVGDVMALQVYVQIDDRADLALRNASMRHNMLKLIRSSLRKQLLVLDSPDSCELAEALGLDLSATEEPTA